MQLSIVCFLFVGLDFVSLLEWHWLILEILYSLLLHLGLNDIHVGCLKLSHNSLICSYFVLNYYFSILGCFYWYIFTSSVKSVNSIHVYFTTLPKGIQVHLCACRSQRRTLGFFPLVPSSPLRPNHTLALELNKWNLLGWPVSPRVLPLFMSPELRS